MRERRLEIALLVLAVAFAAAGWDPRRPATGAFGQQPREPGVLRVVTWNVGRSARGGLPLADDHLDHVAAQLKRLDPDLVLLQELADRAQGLRLRSRLGGAWKVEATAGSGRHLAVAWRAGSVAAIAIDAGEQSVMLVDCRFDGGPPVTAMNLHASAYSARLRNEVIGRSVDGLLARARGGGAVLLAGDLNLDVDLGKRRDLFTDDEHLDVAVYNYVALRLADAALGTGSTAEPDRRLDYIFFGPDALELVRAGPWKGRRIGAMDHDPVVADMRFR